MANDTPKGFTLVSDADAKELAEVCPPHKIIIECCWEVVVAAFAVSKGAETVGELTRPYAKLIQNNPELKKLAGEYSLRAHEITRQMFALAQEFGQINIGLGLAIENADHDYKSRQGE